MSYRSIGKCWATRAPSERNNHRHNRLNVLMGKMEDRHFFRVQRATSSGHQWQMIGSSSATSIRLEMNAASTHFACCWLVVWHRFPSGCFALSARSRLSVGHGFHRRHPSCNIFPNPKLSARFNAYMYRLLPSGKPMHNRAEDQRQHGSAATSALYITMYEKSHGLEYT